MVRTLPVISLKVFWDRPVPDLPKSLALFWFSSSSQHLSVISSKHSLCLQLELRPTGTPVRLKNLDYLGLKTQTLPDHSLKNARWDWIIEYWWWATGNAPNAPVSTSTTNYTTLFSNTEAGPVSLTSPSAREHCMIGLTKGYFRHPTLAHYYTHVANVTGVMFWHHVCVCLCMCLLPLSRPNGQTYRLELAWRWKNI